MTDDFLQILAEDIDLQPRERAVLSATDVRSYEDLHALVQAFPSIVTAGVELPKLSNAAFMRMPEGFATFSEKAERDRDRVSFGALPPMEASLTEGATVGLPSPIQVMADAVAPAHAGPIDLRLADWPVRNQDRRGACVAFGTIACVEHALASRGERTDLSEQFLYWTMKTATADPYPHQDGSWLEFSQAALAAKGVCEEGEWPYVGRLVNPVSGAISGQPTAGAIVSAATRRLTLSMQQRNPKQAAAKVLAGLMSNRPVAICLPVFSDALTPNGQTNWTTSVGWAYGHVLNPPPTSKVTGGHCVCIVGYRPDPSEPAGGYFIIRNSWSEDWGSANPDPAGFAPARGYGYVSATYLNTYAWEIAQV